MMTGPIGGNKKQGLNDTVNEESVLKKGLGSRFFNGSLSCELYANVKVPEWVSKTVGVGGARIIDVKNAPSWMMNAFNKLYEDVKNKTGEEAKEAALAMCKLMASKNNLDEDAIADLKIKCQCIADRWHKQDYVDDDVDISKFIRPIKTTMSKTERGARIFLLCLMLAIVSVAIVKVHIFKLILAAFVLYVFIFTMLFRAFKNEHSILQSEALVTISMEGITGVDEHYKASFRNKFMEDLRFSVRYLWLLINGSLFRGKYIVDTVHVGKGRSVAVFVTGKLNTVEMFFTELRRIFGLL